MSNSDGVRHEPVAPLSDDFPRPAWVGRPRSAHWRRSVNESWISAVTPESLARPPRLAWTEEQHRIVRDSLAAQWAEHLWERQWLTVSWPPEASLWAAGEAFLTEAEYCEEHEDDYQDACEVCRTCKRPVEQVKPAMWEWNVMVETWENDENGVEWVESDHQQLIMWTYVDPRDVDYAEGEWD